MNTWNALTSFVSTKTSAAYKSTAKWTNDTAMPMIAVTTDNSVMWIKSTAVPAIGHAADVTLKNVDLGCMGVNRAAVAFLTKYPGIAMTLSPSSMIKMAVANHVDELMNTKSTHRPSVVVDLTLDKQ